MTPDDAHPAAGAGAAQAHALAAESPPEKPGLVARGKAVWTWVTHTRPMRANARFGARGGGVLSGGIAYAGLFSVFAALTICFTAFVKLLGGNENLRDQVLKAIDKALPGIIDTGDGNGLVKPDKLVITSGLTVSSAIAVVVLLLSAMAAVASLRRSVRAMFDDSAGGNAMLGKARELGGFLGMALAVLLSAIITIAVTTATQWVFGALGWGGATTSVLTVVGVLIAFVVDASVFILIVTVLAGQHPPRKDLLLGATLAGIGLGVVRILGTSIVAGTATKNPLFSTVVVFVTLLLWINLIARIVLLAAAWTANPPFLDPEAQAAQES